MKLAKVIGTIVASQKDQSLDGAKILIIQPLDGKLSPCNNPIAAIDTVQSGYGDVVYYTLAREATLALPNTFAPVDAAITGYVDTVNYEPSKNPNFKKIFVKETR